MPTLKTSLTGLALCLGWLAAPALAADKPHADQQYWPQWRGPERTGVAPLGDPPVEWSETKNVKWKTKLPGYGHSSPVVWGDKIFVLTAIESRKPAAGGGETTSATTPPRGGEGQPPLGGGPGGKGGGSRKGSGGPGGKGGGMSGSAPTDPVQFVVVCVDRQSGKILWQQTAKTEVPHQGHQPNNTFASTSPITDGERVYAFFGSHGIHCYDVAGKLLWSQQFGRMNTANGFGEGASPALSGDALIVNWDHEGEDFITALDKRTGKTLWKTARDERTTWTTPLVVTHGGQTEVIVPASGKTRSYDIATGKLIWECGGQTANVIPTAVANNEFVFAISGYRGNSLQAIKLGRTGDLTGSDAVAWSYNKSTPYVPSPLLYGDNLYFVSNNNNILSCFNAKTGQPNYEAERLEGIRGIYASPVGAGGRVYVVGREGTSLVLKNSAKFEVLAKNTLSDPMDASPAIADKEIFLRGHENLYCIAQ